MRERAIQRETKQRREGGRAALKGRKGEMTGSERARGERGLDTGEKYGEEKKAHERKRKTETGRFAQWRVG